MRREDNNCVENENGQEGFVSGYIFSVISVQTIGEPTSIRAAKLPQV